VGIFYEQTTSQDSEPLWLLNSTFLQIGNVSAPTSDFWRFSVSGNGQEEVFDIESTEVKSLIVSVPSQGHYSIRALRSGSDGFFETDAGLWSFDVSSNFSFVPSAHFMTGGLPTPAATATPTETFTVPFRMAFRHRNIYAIGFACLILVDW
jgi:hypothetical protein